MEENKLSERFNVQEIISHSKRQLQIIIANFLVVWFSVTSLPVGSNIVLYLLITNQLWRRLPEA